MGHFGVQMDHFDVQMRDLRVQMGDATGPAEMLVGPDERFDVPGAARAQTVNLRTFDACRRVPSVFDELRSGARPLKAWDGADGLSLGEKRAR